MSQIHICDVINKFQCKLSLFIFSQIANLLLLTFSGIGFFVSFELSCTLSVDSLVLYKSSRWRFTLDTGSFLCLFKTYLSCQVCSVFYLFWVPQGHLLAVHILG